MLALVPGLGPILAVVVIFLAATPFSGTVVTAHPLLATIAFAALF